MLRCLTRWFSLPPHQRVGLPLLSPTMTKGTLAKWLKREGEAIKPGNVIAEIETDKATVGFEATDDGFLAKILVPEGAQDLLVGSPIAIFVEDEAAAKAFLNVKVSELVEQTKPAEVSTPAPPPPPAAAQPPKVEESKSIPHDPNMRASPAAWALSEEHHINLAQVAGTGVRGLVTKEDILNHLRKKPVVSPPSPAVSASPPRGIRAIAPRFSLRANCAMDSLIRLQQSLKDAGTEVSLEALVVKCAAVACLAVPYANASFLPTATRLYEYVDVKFRQLAGKQGSVSYIRDAQVARLGEIQRQLKAPAADGEHCTFEVVACTGAETSTFQPDTAFVRVTQACNLTIGRTAKALVPPGSDGKLGTVQECTFVLDCDHRVVDGAVGAQWLQRFKSIIENPIALM